MDFKEVETLIKPIIIDKIGKKEFLIDQIYKVPCKVCGGLYYYHIKYETTPSYLRNISLFKNYKYISIHDFEIESRLREDKINAIFNV